MNKNIHPFQRLLALLIVTGLILVMAGCATKEPTKSPEKEPTKAEATKAPAEETTEIFKLGILGPFSGPSARTGEEFKASATMALEAIGSQIGKYKIEPVWIDSQSDPAKASQAYEQAAVQDEIQAGVLNWHSSVAVSTMEMAAKYKIPHFFGFGATEVVNETYASDPEKYGYWTCKGWPTPKKLSISYVQALEDAIDRGVWTPEEKTVAIWGEDTDWGRSFGGAIKGQLEDAGWKVVALDCGVKRNILRLLVDAGVEVTVVPAGTSAADILAMRPEGVFLSNGPGDRDGETYPKPADEDRRTATQAGTPGRFRRLNNLLNI